MNPDLLRPRSLPERIVALELHVMAAAEFRVDAEARLRRIELTQNLGIGAVLALQLVLKFIL